MTEVNMQKGQVEQAERTVKEELERSLPARALSSVVFPEPGGPKSNVRVPCTIMSKSPLVQCM